MKIPLDNEELAKWLVHLSHYRQTDVYGQFYEKTERMGQWAGARVTKSKMGTYK